MKRLGILGAVAVASTMLATPVLAESGVTWQSGQLASEFGGQQDSRAISGRNTYTAPYAYGYNGGPYAYYNRGAYAYDRGGFGPGDVAAGVVGGALNTAGAAIGTAGAIASAPFRAENSYAAMTDDDVYGYGRVQYRDDLDYE